MSHLRFDGQGAGLGKRQSGNANSAADYTLICTCAKELGPLAGFFPNGEGTRTILCLQCNHVTLVGKDGQVKAYIQAPKEILDKAVHKMVLQVKT